MSSFLSELGGITAGVGAEGLAFAAGFAAAHALEPEAVTIKQDAWHGAPVLRVPPEVAAAVAAENIAAYSNMQDEAQYAGWDESRFAYLYHVNLVAPGTGELLQMLRRGTINPGNFTHGLRKNKLEPMWDGPVADLANVYLDPAILAVMLQRNVIPDQGQLPGVTLSTTGVVPRFPHVPIDAYAMAAKFGWSQDQLDAQTRIQGLPPGMDLVARMVFRKIVDRGDFNLAAEQSNRRVEWADFEFDGYRDIPTARDGIEYRLRGWTDDAGMYAQTARHGMTQADSDLLLKVTGRPLSFHQVYIGERRGGVYGGPTDAIDPAFLKSLQESNIRPEWYNLAWAQRNTYPSAFVLRALTEAGDLTQAETEQILDFIGWPLELATKVSTRWAGTTSTASDPNVKKAQTHEWTTAQSSYINGESDAAAVAPTFAALGVTGGARTEVLASWDRTAAMRRKQLTPTQLKKAWGANDLNPATGAAWTKDEALERLHAMGYSTNDAATFLEL